MSAQAQLDRSRKELARNTVAGAVTTASVVALLNKLDVLRIQWQTRPRSAGPPQQETLRAFATHVLRTQGVVSVWTRGLGVNAMSVALSSGIRQGFYPTVRDVVVAWRGPNSSKSAFDMAASGLLSGAIGFFLATPFFAAKIRAQSYQATGSGWTHLRAVFASGKPYSGGSVLVARGALFSMGASLGYDYTKTLMRDRGVVEGPLTHVAASLVSSLMATTASAPMDALLTRHASSTLSASPGTSPWTTLAVMVRQDGLSSLYRGWTLFAMRVFPLYVIQLPAYEAVRKLLGIGYMT